MPNILILDENSNYLTFQIKNNNEVIKNLKVFKSYEALKEYILKNIEEKVNTTYNSKLKRDSKFLLKKEIDESLSKRMIHLTNLKLENNKDITVFEIFTKEQTLTLENIDKDFIEELIYKYNLEWAAGNFSIYKLLNFYESGLIFKLEDKDTLNQKLKIDLIYADKKLSIDNLNLENKGRIILDYEVINGLLSVNTIKINNNSNILDETSKTNNKNNILIKETSNSNNLENYNNHTNSSNDGENIKINKRQTE